ncbi:DUF550 domain-containing protein [Salmonella enterica subsp. enterica serovar Gatow]|nr:DUF550 domain-containing protein [Salmonella enterica subsp. enterica serovar Gatow]
MTTITSKFTKERLIDWAVVAVAERGRDLKDAPESVEAAANLKLAEIALAALTAEPVRYLNKFSGTCVTLEQQPNAADDIAVYIPLYAAPPVPEREQIRREHAEWSDATFGDVGPVGPLKHLSKEALEAAADPSDPLEWADMQFLLWDAQRRAGISDEQITQAMIEKLAVNKQREWPEPKDGEPRLHVKEQPMLVATGATYSRFEDFWSSCKHPFAQDDELKDISWVIWNACRAAMLQSKYRDLSQPVDSQISEYEKIMLRAGWVMVPVEPTDEMIAAAMNCEDVLFNSDESFCVQFGNIYEAMLAAAPQEVK